MKKTKVLLLFPNTSNEGVVPLAVATLSSIAKQSGVDIEYFETSFYEKSATAQEEREQTGEFKPFDRKGTLKLLPHERIFEDFNAKLNEYKPDILAVTANSLEYELFLEMMGKLDPDGHKPFVIIGGVHATLAPEEVMQNPYVDALCIGEAERAWAEFLVSFSSGRDISSIQNLWIKTLEGVKKNPVGPLLGEDELWETPLDLSYFDDRHLLKPFDGKTYRKGYIEVSRGCPYSCSYCVNSAFKNIYKGLGKFMRVRPIESLKKGILELMGMNCNMLQLQDECFLSIPYERLEKFCKWYGSEVRLPLLLQTRPESTTDEKVKLVADMGVPVQITCGIESGSPRILRDICNRKMSIDQIVESFRIIKKYKLRSNAYTMIGFPTETREEVFETIHLIRKIEPDISIMSVFFPFHGVPLRTYCQDKGYITGDEKAQTFTQTSVLRGQPMSREEIDNLRRTYSLYTRLPEKYFPDIELCERDYEGHKELFKQLVDLSWSLRQTEAL